MIFCYVDESGTFEKPGNTSHFVLAGITIPENNWKSCEEAVTRIKTHYNLQDTEIHTAWMLRGYREQNQINNFEYLDAARRVFEVDKLRTAELLRLQKLGDPKRYHQAKKNFQQTRPYIHLTLKERTLFIEEVARTIGDWGFVRLFADCIDKVHYDPSRHSLPIEEEAFEQLVSRFETYLSNMNSNRTEPIYGMIIHDNNRTIEKRFTKLMKKFHSTGTLWTKVRYIIDTPLFVSSELTSMIQLADVCSYALRRYLENHEENIFCHIFKRADRRSGIVVGVRHFTDLSCSCKICLGHRP